MAAAPDLLAHDWLGASRRAAAGLRGLLEGRPSSGERRIETGRRGKGGDPTLVIDAEAEELVFDELRRLNEAGARFTAVSEERGMVDFGAGGGAPFVVIDPIDGSLNAKRGLPHHALSIALADGPTMADVIFGYVYDLGPDEEWHAVLGGGAFLDGARLEPAPERRSRNGLLEVVAVESAHPRWLAASSEALCDVAGRVRVLGAIAVALCQVAAGRVDGMATLWMCRSVDAAAGQLIVRESGGLVAFTGMDDDLGAPLDLEPRSPVVAARTQTALDEMRTVPAT
jgi:myo-inositol-1(or 4)-monophosphatase